MPRIRTKTITARVTDDEYVLLARSSGPQTVSAWARDVLLAAATITRPPTDQVILGEMLALRTIVLNVQFALVTGERQTADTVQRLIERADHEKLRKAHERLLSAGPRRG